MSRIKNGFLFATIALLIATSQVQGQTSDLVPPMNIPQQNAINRLKSGPSLGLPFLPLIDDVIDRAFYQTESDMDQPTAITCQLNAPLPFDSKSKDSNCHAGCNQPTTVDGLAVSEQRMMMVTPELRIQHECQVCDLCGIESSRCETCCDACANEHRLQCTINSDSTSIDRPMDQYCDQVASMLMTTLNDSRNNPNAQHRAIQTALKMVADKSNRIAEAETDKLQKSHQQSLKQILMEHARKGQTSFVADNKSLLEPIYATQFRNSKQLTKLNDADHAIMRSLLGLEKKFASFTMMQRAKLSGAEVQRMMDSLEEEKAREQELEQLQADLQVLDKRIQQLQTNPVRPANHLEPIDMPARPLSPMTNPYKR